MACKSASQNESPFIAKTRSVLMQGMAAARRHRSPRASTPANNQLAFFHTFDRRFLPPDPPCIRYIEQLRQFPHLPVHPRDKPGTAGCRSMPAPWAGRGQPNGVASQCPPPGRLRSLLRGSASVQRLVTICFGWVRKRRRYRFASLYFSVGSKSICQYLQRRAASGFPVRDLRTLPGLGASARMIGSFPGVDFHVRFGNAVLPRQAGTKGVDHLLRPT